MKKFTNKFGISPVMGVFLATDDYDFIPSEKSISVTTLLKSEREIILSSRIKPSEMNLPDISQMLASRLGHAIHAAIEKAWLNNYRGGLSALGYPDNVIDLIRINPTEPEEGTKPVWLEFRTSMPIHKGWRLSGCTDVIIEGEVRDIKSTGIFAWVSGSMNNKYRLQLSMYALLNKDKVTKPQTGYIEYLFKDWDKLEASYKSNYPILPVMTQPIPLLSYAETEKFIVDKIDVIEKYWNEPQEEIPLCSPEDLWASDSNWGYYGKFDAKKASKSFPTKGNPNAQQDANNWCVSKGKGFVKFNPGKAKRCAEFCPVSSICSQYADLKAKGLA